MTTKDLVIIEIMPRHLRASHEAARNRGSYPHNGAVRFVAERADAEARVEADPEWSAILRDATELSCERYGDIAALEQFDA